MLYREFHAENVVAQRSLGKHQLRGVCMGKHQLLSKIAVQQQLRIPTQRSRLTTSLDPKLYAVHSCQIKLYVQYFRG